jgi:signal peptidase II
MVLRTGKPAGALSWLWLSLVVVVLDQATKFWALDALAPAGVPHPVIPGFLNWTLAFNTGAAFSFLATGSGWQRWFFVLLAVVISFALASWLKKTPRADWKAALPLALVIGGAVGNLIDRLHTAKVTDFIEVYWRTYYYPVFNVADCAISVGAVLLVLGSLFQGKKTTAVR